MAIFGNMSITNAGQILYTKAQAGKPIVFTKLSIGSGQIGTQNPATLTNLVQSKFDILISSIIPNTLAQSAAISGTINNANILEAAYICEIGLWAMDPDVGLILYSYASAGTLGDYMAPATQGAYTWMYQINASIGNATNITAKIGNLQYDYGIVISDTTLQLIAGGNQMALNKSIDNKLKSINDQQVKNTKDLAENVNQIKIKNNITILNTGWLLDSVTELYKYDIANTDILATTAVDVNIKLADLDKANDIKTANDSFAGYVRVYADAIPLSNITCDLKLIRQVF
ncbi:hypothetical protein KTC96_24680 (plasmid) [Clostridium estertheticum]|uniref:hypothetical protein n=1 Tax=Clostridium estertheticum TaxID=238834 RepID=UPI001C7D1256|nr:hypothetical protein [Clostridium estertheticum]MBX4259724.1 hypothetical protein [Clostridium estertheticum]WLC73311.1 hypothetical protein KTC96_24680 [Clostridium estertheticum]